MKRLAIALAGVLLTSLALATAAAAQGETRGSIRGTIREDKNGDGFCAGEPAKPGIPIEFVSNDGETVVFLQSGDDGTYGLVAAGLGTWKVSARPPSDYIVTSTPTREAFLGENQRLVLGIDFCVRKASAGYVVLPDAGGTASALVGWLFVGGLLTVAAGAGITWRRRNA